jgi:hypothetical protein
MDQARQGGDQVTRLSCRSFAANFVRLQLYVLTHNLGNFMRTLAMQGDGVLPDRMPTRSICPSTSTLRISIPTLDTVMGSSAVLLQDRC